MGRIYLRLIRAGIHIEQQWRFSGINNQNDTLFDRPVRLSTYRDQDLCSYRHLSKLLWRRYLSKVSQQIGFSLQALQGYQSWSSDLFFFSDAHHPRLFANREEIVKKHLHGSKLLKKIETNIVIASYYPKRPSYSTYPRFGSLICFNPPGDGLTGVKGKRRACRDGRASRSIFWVLSGYSTNDGDEEHRSDGNKAFNWAFYEISSVLSFRFPPFLSQPYQRLFLMVYCY